MTKTRTKIETNGHKPLTADHRVLKCGEEIKAALDKYNCRIFTALRIGNAESPLMEIGGLPIVIKVSANAEKA
jgi:hypothetical protein